MKEFSATIRSVVRFGTFELDVHSGELRKAGVRLNLPDQPLQVLCALLERPGDLVTRDELRLRLWPSDTFVDFEHGLNAAVKRLRGALGDSADTPRFVETLPRRGYRFIAPVQDGTATRDATGTVRPAKARFVRSRVRNSLFAIAGIGVVLTAAAIIASLGKPAGELRRPTIALVGLKNMSGDPGQDYFAEGLTEALASAISRIGGVRLVTAGTSARYGDDADGRRRLGHELRVATVLHGSVVRNTSRIHVTVSLSDIENNHTVWTAAYDHDMVDVLTLYEEIATAIARETSVALRVAPNASRGRLRSPDAYDAYLRGMYYRDRWMSGGCVAAEREFLRAIAMDSAFASPYTYLAICYAFPDTLRLPYTVLGPKARAAVDRALALDPDLPEAHLAQGVILHHYDFNWQLAGKELKRSLALNPNAAEPYVKYGELLYMSGHVDDGLAHVRQGLSLDPFSPDRNTALGFALKDARRYDEAIAQFRRTLSLQPDYATAQLWLAESYAESGHAATAAKEYVAWLDAVVKRERAPEIRRVLTEAYARGGPTAFWLAELRFAEEERQIPGAVWRPPYDRYVGSFYMARRCARLGRWREALDYLDESYRNRHHQIVSIAVEPTFDGMRHYQRFRDLLQKIGLDQPRAQ